MKLWDKLKSPRGDGTHRKSPSTPKPLELATTGVEDAEKYHIMVDLGDAVEDSRDVELSLPVAVAVLVNETGMSDEEDRDGSEQPVAVADQAVEVDFPHTPETPAKDISGSLQPEKAITAPTQEHTTPPPPENPAFSEPPSDPEKVTALPPTPASQHVPVTPVPVTPTAPTIPTPKSPQPVAPVSTQQPKKQCLSISCHETECLQSKKTEDSEATKVKPLLSWNYIIDERHPVWIAECPSCGYSGAVNVLRYHLGQKVGGGFKTKTRTGPTFWTWLAVLALILIFWPLCWAPLVLDRCKQTEHFCPHCNHVIGTIEPFQDCCVQYKNQNSWFNRTRHPTPAQTAQANVV